MPTTEKQLAQRQRRIGASDVAAVLGISPWSTPYDVWLDKTNQLVPGAGSEAAHAGNMFEPGVLDHFRPELPRLLTGQRAYRSCPELHLGAFCDSIVESWNVPADVKTAGLYGPLAGDWGDEGTGEVPDYVVVQLHAQMICCDRPDHSSPYGLVLAFLGGRGFCKFKIERSQDLEEMIRDTLPSWWQRHVVDGIPPAETLPSPEVAKRIRREPGATTTIPPDIVQAWRKSEAEADEAKAKAAAFKQMVITALGQAEVGDAGPAGSVSYKRQTHTSVSMTRLRERHPELCEEFKQSSSFPVLRYRPPK